MISDRTKAALAAAKPNGKRLGNPNGAAPLRRAGKGNSAAVAALRQQADEHAENIMPVIDRGRKAMAAIRKLSHGLV